MAKVSLAIINKPAPYQYSVKAVGDPTERFTSVIDGEVEFTDSPTTLSYVISVTDASGKTHSDSFTLNCTPELPNCGSGPTLNEIKNVTKNGLSFVQTSTGVEQIVWRLFLGDIQIVSDIIENIFSNLSISFSTPLPDGTYRLEIEGSSCKSGTSSLNFTINDSVIPLAFLADKPKAVPDIINSFIIGINKTGPFLTTIKNLDTGQVIFTDNLDYISGESKQIVREAFVNGNYSITVGSVTANVLMGSPLPACDRGPFLLEITSFSRTSVSISFDALYVSPLRYRIRQDDNVLVDEVMSPPHAFPTFTFNSLSNGTYTLGIKGVTCSSDWSEKTFAISGSALTITGVTVDVVDGYYEISTAFTGGTPNFGLFVKTQTGDIIAQVGNLAVNPIVIRLPSGTAAQTVSVLLQDSNLASDEELNVVLPSIAGSVSPCGVFVNYFDSVYSYASGSITPRITGIVRQGPVNDMANTANKIFVLDRSTNGTARHIIKEYAITLSPFTQSFTRDYTVDDPSGASGLCAASDTHLFLCGSTVQSIILDGSVADAMVLFTLPDGSYCTGDIMYDPVSRLFAITYENGSYTKIGIFTESGNLLRSAAIPARIYGIYQDSGLTYMVTGDGFVYKIDILSLVYSQVGSLGTNIVGASQSPDCISIPSGVTSNQQARQIYMNTTGYGFDAFQPNGISPEWVSRIEKFRNMNYNGVSFSGITGVRLCMKWCDYEVTEGVYQDAKLIEAINWLKARGLKASICFWAYRKYGDDFFPDSDKATGSGGTLFREEADKYTFAIYSESAKVKLKTVVKHLAQQMAVFGNDVDYISLGYGNTEEYFMPIIKTYNPDRDSELTGYAAVDRAAWTPYIASRGYAGTAMPVSANAADPFVTGDMLNTTIGKIFQQFRTDGIAGIHAAFRDGVREGGMKVCGFFADAGTRNSATYGTYQLDQIFAGCDYVYSTEGTTRDQWGDKLMAIDIIAGTFPSAKKMIEGDPEDLSSDYSKYYGNPVDGELLKKYLANAFERGLYAYHFAMAFSSGDSQGPDNISPLAPALYYIKTNYIDQANIATIPSVTVPFNITNFSGEQPYRGLWGANGGGLAKQVKIALTS